MSKSEQRKAAIAAFRGRKPRMGIYAMRCLASGAVWVGRSSDLGAIRNRTLFTLAQGTCPDRTLQDAWDRAGSDNLVFEEVELLVEELATGLQDLWLKQRLLHWVTKMNAKRI